MVPRDIVAAEIGWEGVHTFDITRPTSSGSLANEAVLGHDGHVCVVTVRMQKFSKVSSALSLLYQIDIELAFEKFGARWQRVPSHGAREGESVCEEVGVGV